MDSVGTRACIHTHTPPSGVNTHSQGAQAQALHTVHHLSQSEAHTDLHMESTNSQPVRNTHNLREAHTPLQSLSWPARTRRCTHNLSHALHAHLKQLCAVHTSHPNFSAARAHSHELSWHRHSRSLPLLQAHPTPTHPLAPVHPSPTPVRAHTENSGDAGCTHAPRGSCPCPSSPFSPATGDRASSSLGLVTWVMMAGPSMGARRAGRPQARPPAS